MDTLMSGGMGPVGQGGMKRMLMLTHRLPYPPDKGERIRAFEELRVLSRRFRIVLGSLVDGDRDVGMDSAAMRGLSPYCERVVTAPVSRVGSLVRGGVRMALGGCVTEGYFGSGRLARMVLEESRRERFDVVLAYSSGVLPLALRVPASRYVADLVDVDSAKWRSYAAESGGVLSWLYGREAAGVARLEREAVERCDATVLVSEAERGVLGRVSERVVAIGNGVDVGYFSRGAVKAQAGWAERGAYPVGNGGAGSVVFTGTMDYRPNIDGVTWFVNYVWPALSRLREGVKLWIVGRDPTAAVRRLGERAGVVVTGSVGDVRPYLVGADVAIAPLRIARGVQNKVLEAMSMGCAVVGSPSALEGLEVEVGRDVLEADWPQDWVRVLDELLSDGDRRARLGRAARRRVEERYLWSSRLAPLVELCWGASGDGGGALKAGYRSAEGAGGR